MAYIYKRGRSPFYWLSYKDASGQRKHVSTKCRIGVGPDERRAKQQEAEKTLLELTGASNPSANEKWAAWVPSFIDVTYGGLNTATLERYQDSWASLRMFLDEVQVDSPRQLTREHCFKFVNWRRQPKCKGRYNACLNTALVDLKILRIIMNEAVKRNYCAANPCAKLGIKRGKGKIKPEYTDEHLNIIERAIEGVADQTRRAFFRRSFLISRYQGCRLNETRLNPQTAVTIETGPDGQKHGTINFHVKGDKDHTTRLHPKLIPLFEELKADKVTMTWENPTTNRQWASCQWFRFLSDIKGLPQGACFHSFRVTVITRLARNQVPETLAQSYVGHASTTVHRTYQRLQPDDLGPCTAVL